MRIFSFFFLFNEFLRNLVIENNLLFLFVGIFFWFAQITKCQMKINIIISPPPSPSNSHQRRYEKKDNSPNHSMLLYNKS